MAHPARQRSTTEPCPYCGHEITHDELAQIESRIEKEQQERFAAQAKQLNAKHMDAMSELHKQFAAKNELSEARLKAIHAEHEKALDARERAAKEAEEVARKEERDKAAKEQHAATTILANDRKALEQERKQFDAAKEIQRQKFVVQAEQLNAKHTEAMSKLRKELADKDESIDAQLKATHAEHEKELHSRERAAKEAEEAARKEEREKAAHEQRASAARLANDRKALEQERNKFDEEKGKLHLRHQETLDRQREVLNADNERKILDLKAAADKDNHRMQVQLEDMKRRLEKKSNEELGDGAEVDLYNDLKAAFPDDMITRVKRGVPGADIKHDVYVDGRLCGKIVYDSKNRADWKANYVEQLRNDQLAEQAEHAILATRKFPQSTKELTIRDGVVMVNPARAVPLAQIMRGAIVQISSVRLSEKNKKDKRDKLYDYVTSTRCVNQFARFGTEVSYLRQIDEREKSQQEKNRRNRAKHVSEMEKTVFGELQREIHDILGV